MSLLDNAKMQAAGMYAAAQHGKRLPWLDVTLATTLLVVGASLSVYGVIGPFFPPPVGLEHWWQGGVLVIIALFSVDAALGFFRAKAVRVRWIQ